MVLPVHSLLRKLSVGLRGRLGHTAAVLPIEEMEVRAVGGQGSSRPGPVHGPCRVVGRGWVLAGRPEPPAVTTARTQADNGTITNLSGRRAQEQLV